MDQIPLQFPAGCSPVTPAYLCAPPILNPFPQGEKGNEHWATSLLQGDVAYNVSTT